MQLSRRRLPHVYVIGEPLFVTFRLHNSLPHSRQFPACLPSGKAFVCMDRQLDQERAGPTYLRRPAIAKVVIASIRKGAPGDYLLHTWVVMPNHVHLLLTPKMDPAVALRRLKGASARAANQLLGLTDSHSGRTRAMITSSAAKKNSSASKAIFFRTRSELGSPWSSLSIPAG